MTPSMEFVLFYATFSLISNMNLWDAQTKKEGKVHHRWQVCGPFLLPLRMALKARGRECFTQELRLQQNFAFYPPNWNATGGNRIQLSCVLVEASSGSLWSWTIWLLAWYSKTLMFLKYKQNVTSSLCTLVSVLVANYSCALIHIFTYNLKSTQPLSTLTFWKKDIMQRR